MSPAIAKVLRQYALFLLPEKVSERWPEMSTTLHRKLKEWWNAMPASKRHGFLMVAKRCDPLPEEYRVLAYQSNIILDWPPKKPRGRDVKRTGNKAKKVSRRSLSEKLRLREMVRVPAPKSTRE